MKHLIVIASMSVLLLVGCLTVGPEVIVTDQKVIVVDRRRSPIRDAEIYAVSLSMNIGPAKTDGRGEASVPFNIQGTRWISVAKEGYQAVQVPVPIEWPLKVILKKKSGISNKTNGH